MKKKENIKDVKGRRKSPRNCVIDILGKSRLVAPSCLFSHDLFSPSDDDVPIPFFFSIPTISVTSSLTIINSIRIQNK